LRRALKYAIGGILGIIVAIFAVDAALFTSGLAATSISPGQTSGNTISITLQVPNNGFIPIDGKIKIQVHDAVTGQLIGSGSNSFSLVPGRANPVTISLPITAITQNPVKVRVDYEIGILGVLVPLPGTEVTMALPSA